MYFSPPSWQHCNCLNFILSELLGLLDWPLIFLPPSLLFVLLTSHPLLLGSSSALPYYSSHFFLSGYNSRYLSPPKIHCYCYLAF
jgi:hypothetical protein